MVITLVQENHTISFWKGKSGRERSFCTLTNFGLRLLKHVRAPMKLPQYSGFVVEVSQRQRSRAGGTNSGGHSAARG